MIVRTGTVGVIVAIIVGVTLGTPLGTVLGIALGALLGIVLGEILGLLLGANVGLLLGTALGVVLPDTALDFVEGVRVEDNMVGFILAIKVGTAVGKLITEVTEDGLLVGKEVG